jgi:branched-chain amino acid transport system ATP-binding protein
MPFLNLQDVSVSFGGLAAVSALNLSIEQGELVGLIGPNGAGKTTVFNLLTGVYAPTHGKITLTCGEKGVELGGMRPDAICGAGVARTFQNIRLFKDLSVLDNVRIAMHQNAKCTLFDSMLHTKKNRREEERIKEETLAILSVFHLDKKKDELARNLPYGEQRHLEIARALATKPRLLLLDEPAAGMNPIETAELCTLISSLRDRFNLTILLIEHDMSLVMRLCERICVLNYGAQIACGCPVEIRSNAEVIRAYLGGEVAHA